MQSAGLRSWQDRAVVAVALASLMAGVGEFGAVAALGDVSRAFGSHNPGTTIADQAGLSGTSLGAGLAVIRLASVGGLLVAGLADRFGRRRTILLTVTAGLVLTAATATSPGYWWFVAVFAAGRPFLSATNSVSAVSAAEHTGSDSRSKALALVAAGYGIGAGLTAIVHGLAGSQLGFRGVFAFAALPLMLLPLIRRWAKEPDRFALAAAAHPAELPVIAAVSGPFRRRLAVVAVIGFALSMITGPGTGFVFLYAQNVRHVPGYLTASMVVAAGASGLAGLLAGRWMADRLGRRVTSAVGMCGLAGLGLVTYAGSGWTLVAGYVLGVGAGSMIAPATGPLITEVFPTPIRASVMGWWTAAGVVGAAAGLLLFGAVADAGGMFWAAAAATFLPATLAVPLFWLLPEPVGREPEDLCPEPIRAEPFASNRSTVREYRVDP